jgi:dCTP deaminase
MTTSYNTIRSSQSFRQEDQSVLTTDDRPVRSSMTGEELDQIDDQIGGVLSSTEILDERERGNVVIEPYHDTNLSNCSYDVTLGDHYYRHVPNPIEPIHVYVPWNPDHVRRYWGTSQTAIMVDARSEKMLGLEIGTKYILIYPGETILAHTNEFIGGKGKITTMMKARSSMGRSGVSICKDAGWGDIGYINRWTLEITNFAQVPVALLVGERIGQIIFFYTGKPISAYTGSYQTSSDLITLMSSWSPDQMLPRPKRDNVAVVSSSL